jgi:drug/metabolite transporter (DMT)-like permease
MTSPSDAGVSLPTLNQGRLLIVLAAVFWSLSGGFSKVLTRDMGWGLEVPEVQPLVMAFYRAFFAGLVLLPALRTRDFSFRRMMVVMVCSFAVMNALFVWALAKGSAANAILLQYTAPMWMYLASVWLLREPPDRRSSVALVIGLVGIVVIVWGGRQDAQLEVILIALGSGFAYAGVILCLRILREASSRWLTVLNHLCGALVLLPFVVSRPMPTWGQLGVLFLFGSVQMGLPYWLVARGLRVVSPQEAGTITLLEPILNPLWAYVVASEVPSPFTLAGGVFIVGGLVWRYWPVGEW